MEDVLDIFRSIFEGMRGRGLLRIKFKTVFKSDRINEDAY